jgi:anti-sigma-K factor RskA
MTAGEHIPQEDLALYAMRSLSADESAAIRAHLDSCAECRAAVAEYSGDLALVALSVEQQAPPDGARERLLNRIAADANVPESNIVPIDAKPVNRVYSSIQWSLVAALVIFAFALMLKIGDMRIELRKQAALINQQAAQSARAQQVLDLLTSKSAQRVLLTAAQALPQPSGRAVYLASSGSLYFQCNNLGPLPAGKTYELWVIPANGAAPLPAGLFQPDATGGASVILPPLPKGVPAKAFGVTMEQAEGSATPTAPILLAGAVSGE